MNCFCIGKGKQALLSQHIGDLKNIETLEFYEEAVNRFKTMFRFNPEVLAVDMHPDYLSRKYCIQQALSNPELKITEIQHHHAHIASCMAEHNLDEEVIGVCLDGVGFGTDGNIWGFEFLTCNLLDFKRELHPAYIPQPGGDVTTREPWRMAISYLHQIYGNDLKKLPLPFLGSLDPDKMDLVMAMINKGINTPLTCSAGRMFDAVAALINLCPFSNFHAEAPMRLEQIAASNITAHYEFLINAEIEIEDVIKGIVEDVINQVDSSIISAKFHNTVIEIILNGCLLIRNKCGINKVVLSGGSFQNRYLLLKSENSLRSAGFNCFSQEAIPTNDGGIALGQIAIAAKRRSEGMI